MNGESREEAREQTSQNSLVRGAHWVSDYGYYLEYALGTVLLAIFCTLIPGWWRVRVPLDRLVDLSWTPLSYAVVGWSWLPVIIIFSIGLFVHGVIATARETVRLRAENEHLGAKIKREKEMVSQLQEKLKIESENSFELVSALFESEKEKIELWLNLMFEELQFGHNHRVSVYYLSDVGQRLELLQSYSKKPAYNVPSKCSLNIDEGVVGKAWQHGFWEDSAVPQYDPKSTKYYRYWKEEYNILRSDSAAFRMRSRSLLARSVTNERGHHVGVILFEAAEEGGMDSNRIINLCQREHPKILRFISEAKARDMPNNPNHQGALGSGRQANER